MLITESLGVKIRLNANCISLNNISKSITVQTVKKNYNAWMMLKIAQKRKANIAFFLCLYLVDIWTLAFSCCLQFGDSSKSFILFQMTCFCFYISMETKCPMFSSSPLEKWFNWRTGWLWCLHFCFCPLVKSSFLSNFLNSYCFCYWWSFSVTYQ